MGIRLRLFVLAASLALTAGRAGAMVNLGNFGGQTGIGIFDGGTFDPTPPGGGGGGAPSYTVSQLESQGYECKHGGAADIVCGGCGFIEQNETQVCSAYLCRNSGECYDQRIRWDVPRDLDPTGFGMWEKEFALGASPYWLGDFNGDGKRDLAGRLNASTVKVALSRGDHFDDVGVFTGPTPVESAGPTLVADVNHDGIADVLSVSGAGHLVAGIMSSSGIAASVELPNTWCEALGQCLIGDVNGDGMPDLLEVMTGAVSGHRPGDVWVSLATDVPGFPSVPSAPVPPDTDGDGIRDDVDDCTAVPNPTQLDSDHDGIGNLCDGDFDNDGIVDWADLGVFSACFGNVANRPECASVDFDGNGVVNLFEAAHLHAMLGKPPGPAAATQPPQIQLFTPEDGTILPVGAKKAWVAGFVPNLPAGGLQVRVAGQNVPVSGPANYFAAFVDLPATDATGAPKVFHDVVVEASAGTRRSLVRRAVIVGEHAAPNRRAHNALGARLTAAGLERIEQYARNVLVPDVIADVPSAINGNSYGLDCPEVGGVPLPVCSTGSTISNAQIAAPDVSVDLTPNGVHVSAFVPSLDLDLTVHMTGPTPADWDCGGHVSATNIQIDLLYGLEVGVSGGLEVVELQEPDVSADVSYGGCGEDKVKGQVKDKIAGFLNDPDDVNGVTHGIYQKSPIGGAVEDLFASLALNGTFTEDSSEPVATQAMFFAPGLADTSVLGQPDPLSLAYDARFEGVSQDTAGISLWLGAGIDPTAPKPGLGSPSGAYQIPGLAAPALPNTLPSGSAFDIEGAVTPNGLNELLDALTRAGVLAKQGKVITQITNPVTHRPIDLTAGLLSLVIDAFSAYPSFEKIQFEVTPPTFAPVVTGRRGPNNEGVDLHMAQLGITLRDEEGHVALAIRADVRVGVDIGLGGSGTGELSAFAKSFRVLTHTITENAIGADPAQVASRILCFPQIPQDAFGCALKDELTNGLGAAIGPIQLPSLADAAAGFNVNARCLQRLADGTFVAQYHLLLPGETLPTHHLPAIALDCIGPLTADPGGGGLGGNVGTIGGTATTATKHGTATVGTAGTATTGGVLTTGGALATGSVATTAPLAPAAPSPAPATTSSPKMGRAALRTLAP